MQYDFQERVEQLLIINLPGSLAIGKPILFSMTSVLKDREIEKGTMEVSW